MVDGPLRGGRQREMAARGVGQGDDANAVSVTRNANGLPRANAEGRLKAKMLAHPTVVSMPPGRRWRQRGRMPARQKFVERIPDDGMRRSARR